MILKGFNEDYSLEKQIGFGYEGSVYLGRNNDNHLYQAVKVIKKEVLREHDLMNKCIINEIQIMRSAQHKHILKIDRIYEE